MCYIGIYISSLGNYTDHRYGKNKHIGSRYITDPIIGTPLKCDQICQKRSCTHTVSGHTFHHLMATAICVYYCQKLNSLLLLWPLSQAYLTSTSAWLVFKWRYLTNSHLAGKHHTARY